MEPRFQSAQKSPGMAILSPWGHSAGESPGESLDRGGPEIKLPRSCNLARLQMPHLGDVRGALWVKNYPSLTSLRHW